MFKPSREKLLLDSPPWGGRIRPRVGKAPSELRGMSKWFTLTHVAGVKELLLYAACTSKDQETRSQSRSPEASLLGCWHFDPDSVRHPPGPCDLASFSEFSKDPFRLSVCVLEFLLRPGLRRGLVHFGLCPGFPSCHSGP